MELRPLRDVREHAALAEGCLRRRAPVLSARRPLHAGRIPDGGTDDLRRTRPFAPTHTAAIGALARIESDAHNAGFARRSGPQYLNAGFFKYCFSVIPFSSRFDRVGVEIGQGMLTSGSFQDSVPSDDGV